MEKLIIINNIVTDYTVEDSGKIFSLNYGRTGKKRELRSCLDSHGYMSVNIYINHKLHRKYVHKLVAEAFIPNDDITKNQVNHMDGDKTNNDISNLEWVTPKENTQHAILHKLRYVRYGDAANYVTITENEANEICRLLEENILGVREIGDMLGIPPYVISNILHKKAWLQVSKDYNIDNHSVKSKPIKKKKKSPVFITENDVMHICEYLQNTDIPVSKIADRLSISKYKINSILYGAAWKYISENYDFSHRNRKKYKVSR